MPPPLPFHDKPRPEFYGWAYFGNCFKPEFAHFAAGLNVKFKRSLKLGRLSVVTVGPLCHQN
jgi:hypothetical protein